MESDIFLGILIGIILVLGVQFVQSNAEGLVADNNVVKIYFNNQLYETLDGTITSSGGGGQMLPEITDNRKVVLWRLKDDWSGYTLSSTKDNVRINLDIRPYKSIDIYTNKGGVLNDIIRQAMLNEGLSDKLLPMNVTVYTPNYVD